MNAVASAIGDVASAAPPAVLQLRSSAGLYGADRAVLALDGALRGGPARSRLLSIHNYLLDAQPLHEAALAAGHDAALLPCRGRLDMRTVSALVAEIDASGAGIVHAHDYKSAFYAWLSARRRPVRLVATQHGRVESSQALRLYQSLEATLLRRFDAVAIVSEVQRAPLLRAGVVAARIHRLDNGIDLPPSGARADAGLRDALGLGHGHVFAAVARFSPEKNLAMLLRAFTAAATADRGATLLLVGDGPGRAELEALAAQYGLADRVRFAGVRDDMAGIYPLIDTLVLPSLSEGMPLVVLEAMAHGVPVVASAVGEVPRLLAATSLGCLLPPGDRVALRAALLEALQRPPGRDHAGAAHVRAHHSSAAMAARHLAMYASLAEAADAPQHA